jgi:hypothetical protein
MHSFFVDSIKRELNMNRMILGLVTVAVLFANGFAQKKDNLDVYVVTGYGFGMGGIQAEPTTSTTKYEDHFFNLGSGLKIEVGADYKLMEHLYAQAAANLSLGVPGISAKQETATASETVNYGSSDYGFKVMLKPTFQVLDLFDVYTNFGLGVFFANSSRDYKYVEAGQTSTCKDKDDYSPAFAIVSGIGLNYPLNASMIIFGELFCEQMSFTIKQATRSNSVGTNYHDMITYYNSNQRGSSTWTTINDHPTKIPGTNVAIRVGIKLPIF